MLESKEPARLTQSYQLSFCNELFLMVYNATFSLVARQAYKSALSFSGVGETSPPSVASGEDRRKPPARSAAAQTFAIRGLSFPLNNWRGGGNIIHTAWKPVRR
jgi:hypothetical protein